MNHFAFIILLTFLAVLSLSVLLAIRLLDHLQVHNGSKLKLIKTSLIIIFIAPLSFLLLKFLAWTPVITLPLVSSSQHSLTHAAAIATATTTDWAYYICNMYLAGLSFMTARILQAYLATRKHLANSRKTVIQGRTVFLTSKIHSPLGFGLFNTRIYLPENIQQQLNERDLSLALTHEAIHVRQYDMLWKLLSLQVRAMLFFAPWQYLLHRRLELELELSCDSQTCKSSAASTNEYGKLLLAMTCLQPKNFIFTHLSDHTIKRRIIAMKTKSVRRSLLVTLLGVCIVVAASFAVAMTGGLTAKESYYNISAKIFIDGKLTSNPRIVTTSNKPAYLSFSNADGNESLKLRVVAKDVAEAGNPIDLNFDIAYKNKDVKLASRPRFIILSEQEGKVNVSNETHQLEIRVIAKRV